MKHLYIALAAALCAASSAQAMETWQFDYVELAGQDDSIVTLLSESATATVLSMTSLAQSTTLFESSALPRESKRGLIADEYQVNVADGYHVTGITVEFDLQGKLQTAQPNGYSHTEISFFFTAVGEGLNHGYGAYQFKDVTDTQSFRGVLNQFNSENFAMKFDGNIRTTAVGAYYLGPEGYVYTDPSYANVWVDNITVTIHTVPVPEPSTYLMLGAGLALLGGLARGRRASA